ncbi:glycine zipper domain-containing protein [Phenylobacterium sp.]|jgi:ElaB/YqjD/DUF883 family membrane-anchored ribosome-binding protein|uniref:glycine zipper domain-containing protein n=1 Tax=Phenylobacterium sp. TaxID=1871053 RepID=UPI002E311577|nr:hypothetical protein [Phenylobacterium sp.]HEX2558886.1 hypothetical protein [Phenylobacterium sp.]
MAANVEAAEDTDTTATSGSTGSAANGLATVERSFNEAARKFEKTVQDSLETLRAQSRAYADTAGQQLDEAQRYVVERVKERPLASTSVAVGVGLILGLLLAGGRRR